MSGTDQSPNLPHLRLLGGFDLQSSEGRVVVPAGRKVRALLASLALSPGSAWPREKLMALLWSDRGDDQARASLRQALAEMRRVLGEPSPVCAENDTISLDPRLVAVDAVQFERLAKAGKLAEAAILYRGPLLDGHGVRDDAFEDWILIERTRLHDLAVDVLERCAASQSGDAAIATAQRLLRLDPAREETHRLLMRLYAAAGQRAQALRQYEHCREILQRDLQGKPDTETERLYRQVQNETRPSPAIATKTAKPDSIPPPDSKPSIAVLPFANMSGDPEQNYFSDGITEDIITELSRMQWLLVIARNSSFTYKGRPVDVKQVGRELGVRYVLEGSVRKAGGRVRIAGQLIDASTGANLWAERFDGALTEVFDLQDQVATSVVGAIAPRLEKAEIERSKRKPTESLDAYDYYLRALAVVERQTRESNDEALRLFNEAIKRDPNFALAYARAAHCYSYRKANGWLVDREQEVAEAARLAQQAIELGRDDAVALCYAGLALAYVVGDLHNGAAFVDRALALNANLATAWSGSGWMKLCFGDLDTAIKHAARAMRLSPFDPGIFLGQAVTALAHLCAGRYQDAAAWSEKALHEQANYAFAVRVAAASHALAGRVAEAQKAMARLRQLDPQLRLSNLGDVISPLQPEDRSKYVEGLRRAGLPE